MKSTRTLAIAAILIPFTVGCAAKTQSWETVRQKDTAGAYHRFLRENPKAPQAAEARERLVFSRLKQEPTAAGYEEFRASYPDSALLAELRPLVEERIFEQVRWRGTAAAHREFLAEFPDSSHAARAAGNVEYLEKRGFAGRPGELAGCADRHPQSDFAADARRSAASIGLRRQSEIHSIGLVLAVEPGTPGAARLTRSFAERAKRHYAKHRVQVVALSGPADPRADRVDAILTLEHGEKRVRAGSDRSFSPGILATTRITLARASDAEVIRSDEFDLKVSVSEYREDSSILFGVAGDRYWDAFFFPDATWSNQHAMRSALDVKKSGVAVDTNGHRAVVLFADGGFDVVDLADPAQPQIVVHYVRPKDLTTWQGVRFIGGRLAIFGGDGLEVYELNAAGLKRTLALDTATVGSLVAVENTSDGMLLAGSRGLSLLAPGAKQPQSLVEKSVLGATMQQGRVYFTDGSSLFIASMATLKRRKAEAQLRIGEHFTPKRVRVWGTTAVVLGETDALLVDVSRPAAPRVRGRVNTVGRGEIRDAMVWGGQLYLLTERGLLVSDAADASTDDALGVAARARMAATGRYLVVVGDGKLQVVDTTPFRNGPRPAASRR